MKRIIALMVALMLAAMMFNINVSATDINGGITSGGGGEGGNRSEYGNSLEAFLNALGDYINGDITIDDFLTVSNKITTDVDNSVYDRLGGNYIEGITSGIVNAVDAFGDNAQYYISEWYEDFLKDYTDLAQIESPNNPDKKGYGAYVVCYWSANPNMQQCFYADYAVITQPNSNGERVVRGYCPNATTTNADGVLTYVTFSGDFTTATPQYKGAYYSLNIEPDTKDPRYIFSFYGDIRYEDGTQAPTDDEFVDTEVLDFSDSSDDELEKLLEDLLNKLNLEMPDLSTMEGLLESIYNRLGTLDSDNDNALLNDINVAIVSLMSSNDKNTQEIVNALLEIRDGLKNDDSSSDEESGETGDSGTTDGHPNHISGILYNVKPLDKNWLNKLFTDKTELKVEYQGNKYYLESCGCLLLDDKYYSVDMNYDSYTQIDYDFNNEDVGFSDIVSLKDGVSLDDIEWGSSFDMGNFVVEEPISSYSLRSSATTASVVNDRNFLSDILTGAQEKKLDVVVGLVDNMIALGVPYDSINNSIYMFESIIFDDYTPQDLTFNAFDAEVTILSYSWFTSSDGVWEDSNYKIGLDIVRLFTSILIGFAWSLSMRKKIVSML